MLFHSELSPGSRVYMQQLVYTVRTSVEPAAIRRAWERVAAAHVSARFLSEGGGGRKHFVVLRDVPLPWQELDLRGLPAAEQAERLEAFLADYRGCSFDVARAPLLRLALLRVDEDRFHLVQSSHHAVLDARSAGQVLHEVVELLAGDVTRVGLAPVASYASYIEWLDRQTLDGARAHFADVLGDVELATPLGVDRRGAQIGDVDAGHRTLRASLGGAALEALDTLARELGLTSATLVCAAWGLLLGRYARSERPVFGVTVSGRPTEVASADRLVGLFINTLPARVDAEGGVALAPVAARGSAGSSRPFAGTSTRHSGRSNA